MGAAVVTVAVVENVVYKSADAGAATMVSGVPETAAVTAELMNVSSTDDAATAVPAAITTTTVMALA